LTRNFYCLNTSPLHKQNWKKPESEKRTSLEAMKTSKGIWSNKKKRQTGWWNRWCRCSINKPNLSCTPLACFIYVVCIFAYVSFWTYVCTFVCLCFWTFMCFWTHYASDHFKFYTYLFLKNFSLFFSSLLFVFFIYTFCWWQKGE